MNDYYNNNDYNNDKITPLKKDRNGTTFFAKITAAALVFGLVAGAGFQGFNYGFNRLGLGYDNSKYSDSMTKSKTDSSITLATNTEYSDVKSDVSTVVNNVMPSIVSISITATQEMNDFFGRTYQNESTGSGSGFIIGQNNNEVLIVTNNHVVEAATNLVVTFADDSTVEATVKGTDSTADLAVVSVDMNELSSDTKSHIQIASLGNSESLKVGEMAIAIGNALGYGQSVTVGYISALNREISLEDGNMTLLQTDAAINPGNSGGALLNSRGEVVGINTVKYASEEVEGMGYAIPITDAIPIITQLMNKEVIPEEEQAYLGIMGRDLTKEYSEAFGIPVGVYVGEVSKNSPAERAGLLPGSIITKLNARDASTMERLEELLSETRANESAELTIQVLENGKYVEKILNVTMGSKSQGK